jgi:hypothetical protein
MKEKVNNLVLFDKVSLRSSAHLAGTAALNGNESQVTYDKLIAEVPKYKMITPSILSDRLRVQIKTLLP